MNRQPALSFVLCVALSGCASLPADAPSYSSAPPAPEGHATVYVYRVGAPPVRRKPDVLVAGVRVIEPPELAYTWVYVKAGEQPFRVVWAFDTGWPNLSFSWPLAAGQSYFLKISGSDEFKGFTRTVGSRARFVPELEARSELQRCCKFLKPEVLQIP